MEVPKSIKTGMAVIMTTGVAAAPELSIAHQDTPNHYPPVPAETGQLPVEQDPNYETCKQLGAVGASSWLIPYKNPEVVTAKLNIKDVDNELCDPIANREQISWDIVSRSPRTGRLARISRGVLKFFGEDGGKIRKKFRVRDCRPSQETRRVSLRQRVVTRNHDGSKSVRTKVAPTVKQYC